MRSDGGIDRLAAALACGLSCAVIVGACAPDSAAMDGAARTDAREPPADVGSTERDAAARDAGVADGAVSDAAIGDAAIGDAAIGDAGRFDVTPGDTAPGDAGRVDGAPADAAPADAIGRDRDLATPDVVPAEDRIDPDLDSGSPDREAGSAAPDVTGGPDLGAWFYDAGVVDAAAPVLYTADRTHSPIDLDIARRLRAVAAVAPRDDTVFMKVGDSITASGQFMACFAGNLPPNWNRPWEINIDLADRDSAGELASGILYFRATALGDDCAFDRSSLAARPGASADWVLAGAPPPLQAELDATGARFAVVMYGSNDIGLGGSAAHPLELKLAPYATNLLAIVDALLARGVIPVLSTLPPRTDDPGYPWIVPTFAAVARAVAQGRRVPLVDYQREMIALGAAASYGLSDDGLHPSVEDYNTACHFDAASLARHGYNVRNLVTLEALARARRAVVDGVTALDPDPPRLQGLGTAGDPLQIEALPFADLRGTSEAPAATFTDYPGCSGAPASAGAEHVYRMVLARPTRLRAIVLDQQSALVHLYLLDASADPAGCLAHAPALIATTLAAGTYHLIVDTPGTTSVEFALLVVECDPADARCD